MNDVINFNLTWWITVFELPVMGSLFWLIWRVRSDSDTTLNDCSHEFETGLQYLRDSLGAFKLEVAKSYVSISYMKEVERRLTDHLIRIEEKIDGQRQSN